MVFPPETPLLISLSTQLHVMYFYLHKTNKQTKQEINKKQHTHTQSVKAEIQKSYYTSKWSVRQK